jgi:hypothetical protein
MLQVAIPFQVLRFSWLFVRTDGPEFPAELGRQSLLRAANAS